MGQKVNPKGFRLAVKRNWDSRYYASKKDFPAFLRADYLIRHKLKKKLRFAAVSRVEIERAGTRVRVTIHTARRGVVIGRKGQELDKMREDLKKEVAKEFLGNSSLMDLILDIQEVKRPDLDAQLVSESIALQIERRVPFRRALKKAVDTAMSLGAKGIRVQCAGRLGGAEIARTEKQRKGRVPLHTLREDIQYGFSEATTLYGLIGVKCWILA